MIPLFLEAALRSLLVGLAVAAGLRLLRVRNVLAQKAAWILVLVSALAMPLLLNLAAPWHLLPERISIVLPYHPMTLLEELQARLQATSGSGSQSAPVPGLAAPGNPGVQASPQPEQAAAPRNDRSPARTVHAHRPATANHDSSFIAGQDASSSPQLGALTASPMQRTQSAAPGQRITVSAGMMVLSLYGGIAALFLLRLAVGLVATIRMWGTAKPVSARQLPHDAASLPLRASGKVASPITIGSAILLPESYPTWDNEKLRIVLAHERSHIRQGDFYLQLFASLYAALFWFSPLGWWLKHELAELAEAISDRAGIAEAASHVAYAQILLEFAATPRQIPIGVAMARPGSLSRRIERLLNDTSFRQCFAGGRRALLAVALAPLALFASTALVRVQAASSTQAPSKAPTVVSVTVSEPQSLPAPQVLTPQPTSAAAPNQPGDPHFPDSPLMSPPVLSIQPEPKAPAAEPSLEFAVATPPVPLIHMDPAVVTVASGVQEGGQLSFDRTLSVSAAARLAVATGSGDIEITRGSGSQIRIHGQIHFNHGGSEEQARQIAANPPIEQNGDTISIGKHQEKWHNISIDYRIEAPVGTLLTANTGSGNIVDEGVGQDVKLQTGSGDIRATSLEGPFTVMTGSGNITAAQTGSGDVVAQTGSGDIEIKDIHGSFHGQTGSGDIKASGTPSASWTLHTGSGNVELFPGNAPLTLDASTASGSVVTDHEMMMQGSLDHHHVHGTLNGGGPTVLAQTGSGDIHVH